MRIRIWLAVAVAALLVLLWGLRSWGLLGPYDAGRLVLRPCFDLALNGGRCGTYYVYEDRVARQGRVLGLNLIVLPALEPAPAADPLFFLAGGPGAAASGHARSLATSALRQRRDIVLLDQRGTGRSNGLDCPAGGLAQAELQAVLDGVLLFDFGDLAACRERLAAQADLRLYTTPIAMDDLDEVRSALGYRQIHLYGSSYGTRAALVYLRQHPDRARSAVLRGVVPMPLRIPQDTSRGSDEALADLFADCHKEPACRDLLADPAAELRALLDRLAAAPATVTVSDPRSREAVRVTFSREHLSETLRLMLYDTARAQHIPAHLRAATAGDLAPFAEQAVALSLNLAERLRLGMFLSVICAEDVPFLSPTPESGDSGLFSGASRMRNAVAACAAWPRGEVPAGYKRHVTSEVPTLLISGAVDPVTPALGGAQAARYLRHSHHLVLPATGHAPLAPGCVETLIAGFLDRASAGGIDSSCVDQLRRPPFSPSLLGGDPSFPMRRRF